MVVAAEQREHARVRTMLLGTVTFDDRTVVCVIENFSRGGARLRVSADLLLPERFDLYVPQHWTTYRVELRWREGEDLGVAFLP